MAKRFAKCPHCGNRVELDAETGGTIVCLECKAHLAVNVSGKRSGRHKRSRKVSAPDLVGQKLGEFEIVDVVGVGGMGAVYKAYQPSLDRTVALKILPHEISSNANSLERFTREARAAAAVNHPNIIEIYSVGEDGGYHYIAMELVEGETLSDMLRHDGPLPVRVALKAMEQTVSALARAHAAGVVHRDIKPSNLLVTPEGAVKVADFGLAKRVESDVDVTQAGTAVGTALYMPPEIARGKPFDARSDLYSLGATFYHLLAGRPPHSGSTTPEVIAKHLEADVDPLADVAPHVPPALAKIIHRLLAKQPSDRYQSAAELTGALDVVEIDPSQSAAPAAPSGTLGELITAVAQTQVDETHADGHPPPTRRRRKRLRTPHVLMIVGASMALAVGLGFVLLSLLNGGDEVPPQPEPPPPIVWQEAWDRAQAEAATLVKAHHFGQALTVYDALGEQHRDWRLEERIRKARAGVLGQAETSWHHARDEAKTLLDGGKVADARTVLQPVIEQYGMPEYADEARRMLAQTSPTPGPKWEEPWRKAKVKADALVKQQRFGEAIKAYEQLGKQHNDPELQDRVAKAAAAVRKSAETAWLAVETEARKQLGQNKYDQAVAALKPILETYGVDSLTKKAQTLRTQIIAAKDKAAQDAMTAKARDAEARLSAALKAVDARVAALDIKGAAAALNKVPSAGLPKDVTARLATRRDEVARLARLKARIIENITKLKPWLRRGTVPVPGSGGRKFKTTGLQIASANEEAITLRDVRAVGEKTRRVTWADLDDAVLGKLLALAVSAKSGDDQLAAGLLALARKDTATAEKHLERAAALGVKIDRYLDPLAAAALANAKALLDARKYAEADKVLAAVAKKYAQTPWFASHKDEVKAARAEAIAEMLYAQAAKLFQKKELWDLKAVLDKLKADYPNTTPVTDTARKPAFAELAKATETLGRFITVRLDGKGDFRGLREAIEAAPPRSLIELQDNGPYPGAWEVPKDKEGIIIRGKRGCWPILTSAGSKDSVESLVQVSCPGTRLERLILIHTSKSARAGSALFVKKGPVSVSSLILYQNPMTDYVLRLPRRAKGGEVDNCLVLGGVEADTEVEFTNSFCLGGKLRAGSGTFKNVVASRCDVEQHACRILSCTILENMFIVPGGSLVLDCIVGGTLTGNGLFRVEYCNVVKGFPLSMPRPGVGCLGVDPQFRDPANFDYRLKPRSPCRRKASDGGDMGCRYTPEMIEILKKALELRKKGLIKF